MKFEFGFEYKGFHFGWYNSELYRLPCTIVNKKYGLKKLPHIKVGNKIGYRVKRDKMSVSQCVAMSSEINVFVPIIRNIHVPSLV